MDKEPDVESLEEFAINATARYGDKVNVNKLNVSQETIDGLIEHGYNIIKEDFDNYKQVWLLENKCPECGAELLGLFGSFQWALRHGEGVCSNCKEVYFQYYHYIGECKKPLELFALSAFPRTRSMYNDTKN